MSPPEGAIAPRRAPWRHWLAFGLCGLLATGTDIGVFALLHRVVDWGPLSARSVAIGFAVVVGWAAHRRFTFRVRTPPSLLELARYVGVAWVSIGVNYAVFALVVAVSSRWPPTLVIVFSSGVAMTVSYVGMRFGVFRVASVAGSES